MFSNFKDAFIIKPQYTIAPPQAVIDTLNTDLPTGFHYVHDHDGYCHIDNYDGFCFPSGKIEIPSEDKELFEDTSKANTDILLKYCYNTQKPLKLLPDENGCFTINGEKIKAIDFIKAPMINVQPQEMDFFISPPKFPAPFNIRIKGEGYELVVPVQRVANHSISAQRFESVSPAPIMLNYILDIEKSRFTFTISVNIDGVSSISDIVAANHIFNAFISGHGYIFNSHIDATPDKSVTPISKDTVSFWDKVLEVEKMFGVSFDASKGVTYNVGNKLLELYRSLVEKKPFKLKKTFNTVSGRGTSHNVSGMSDIVGKEILFEFMKNEEAEIMGSKLSYYGLFSIFGASVEQIIMPPNDTSGKFDVKLATTKGKTMYSSTMYFLSEEELNKYREDTEHIKILGQSTQIDYLV